MKPRFLVLSLLLFMGFYEAAGQGTAAKKILPFGTAFPFDFGFVPGTLGEDGQPIDVLVLSEFPFFPGCVIQCRCLGKPG